MGIITAEALYPAAYRRSTNTISDIGGTRPPDGVVLQPSAAIFDTTMIVAGLLIVAGAYLARRVVVRPVTVPLALLGIGVLGVAALGSLVAATLWIDWRPVAELGEGGIERRIAYPVVLWLVRASAATSWV